MTSSPEILENPMTGETLRVLTSTDELFSYELALRPGALIAGVHIHPFQKQRLSVAEGTMLARIEGRDVVLRAGESVDIPPGTPHDQSNPYPVQARVIEEIRPAARMHDFFRVFFGLARDGLTDKRGVPSPLVTAALFDEFRDSIRPGKRRDRILIGMLTPIARLFGKRKLIRARRARR